MIEKSGLGEQHQDVASSGTSPQEKRAQSVHIRSLQPGKSSNCQALQFGTGMETGFDGIKKLRPKTKASERQGHVDGLKRCHSDPCLAQFRENGQIGAKPKTDNIPNIMQDANLLVVSNRGPAVKKGELCIAPGGLATAMEGALKAAAKSKTGGDSAAWISYSGKAGPSNRETEYKPGENEHLTPPVKNPNPFRAVQFDIPSDVYSGFYNEVANDLLWPAFHGGRLVAHAASITDEQWKQYELANSAYTEAATSKLDPERPNVVWIQDYQLLLAPGMVRDKSLASLESSIREDTRIGYFHHIPCADFETLIKVLGRLETTKAPGAEEASPEQEPEKSDLKLGRQRACQIVRSLLKCDLVGFQVQRDCNNFMDLVVELSRGNGHDDAGLDLPSGAVNKADGTIRLADGRTVRIAPYPINIKWEDPCSLGEKVDRPMQKRHELAQDLYSAQRIDLHTQQVLSGPKSIFVYGIERFDYTKGIEERINAIEICLKYLDENNPHPDNQVVFVMTLSETRGDIPAYKSYQDRVRNKIAELNKEYRKKFGYTPIVETGAVTSPDKKCDWMVNADIFLMNALKDGMNLTLQEVLAHKRFKQVDTENPDSNTRQAQLNIRDEEKKLEPNRAQHMPVIPIISSEAGVGTLEKVKMHCLMLKDPGDQTEIAEKLKEAINLSAILKKDDNRGNIARSSQAFSNASLQRYFSHNDVGFWAAAYLQDLVQTHGRIPNLNQEIPPVSVESDRKPGAIAGDNAPN